VFRRSIARVAVLVAVLGTTVAISGTAVAATPVTWPVITLDTVIFSTDRPVTATFSPNGVVPGAIPVAYQYHLNDGRTRTALATDGTASIVFTPTVRSTTLYVQAVAADGSLSATTTRQLLASAATPAADHDMDGDGLPDLLVVGAPDRLGSGLWLASERASGADVGKLHIPAANIGAKGFWGDSATDFDGTRAITGNFSGEGWQDVLTYWPDDSHSTMIITVGSGDGSTLNGISGNTHTLSRLFLADIYDGLPVQLANAYDASGNGYPYPDMIGVSSGDGLTYTLAYYPNFGYMQGYMGVLLDTATPTGGHDWNSWQFASTSLPSGTAMFLWNQQTGALYLWEGLHFVDNFDGTGSVSFTQYEVAQDWHTGESLAALQAADFGADGVPELWTVDAAGAATANLLTISAKGVARIRAKTPQPLG
jgi:hypothetical protein